MGFKDFLAEEKELNENVLQKLEKTFKVKLKSGRNEIEGYPFDLADQDPEEGISLDVVDRNAHKELNKLLKKKGFKTTQGKTDSGELYITINEYVEGINEYGVGYLITRGLFLVAQSHVWHLVTTNAQQHCALGEFYSELGGTIDELAEKFIAQGGVLIDLNEPALSTSYDEFEIVRQLNEYRSMIAGAIDLNANMTPVNDGLGDIMELIDAKLYKFKLK